MSVRVPHLTDDQRNLASFVAHAPVALVALGSLAWPLLFLPFFFLMGSDDAHLEPWARVLCLLLGAGVGIPLLGWTGAAVGAFVAAHTWLPMVASRDPRLAPGERTAWTFGLVFLGLAGAPAYYWLHLHPRPAPPDPAPDLSSQPTVLHPLPPSPRSRLRAVRAGFRT